MTYDDLLQLKEKQEARYKEWQKALVQSALDLRDEVEQQLGPPALPESAEGRKGRYVEIVNIQGDNEQATDKLTELKVTDEGVMVFGISVGFSRLESGPIGDFYYVPVAIRFIKEKLHYQIYAPDEIEADQWINDLPHFCTLLFEELAEGFLFDPFEGPKTRRQIGFLKNIGV